MNADGSDRRQLTVTSFGDRSSNPAWSPDGSQIAFVKDIEDSQGICCHFHYEIFLMSADGSNQHRLTQPGVAEWQRPSWSPDGTKIAFTGSATATGSFLLYVMNADGSNQKVIGEGLSPSWSPDGSKLAVRDFRQMYVLNVDGSGRTPLAPPQNPATDWDLGPVWSPVGTRIAFARGVNCDWANGCDSTTIWTVNADGTHLTKVSNMEAPYGHNWSPDGTKIILASPANDSADLFVMNTDGSGSINITNTPDISESVPSWQPVLLAPSVIDETQFFVRQHYLDFLNREADPSGLSFWTSSILSCGSDSSCLEVKRVNTSAAYFLSIESQQTGYLVYRMYKSSYGNLPNAPVPIKLSEFTPDTQQIGQGVIVNQTGWEQRLENNKQAFANDFVQRSRFASAYPTSLTPDQFVDTLFANAGVIPSASDRAAAISEFASAMTTNDAAARARALRRVAETSTLAQQEFNRAFVLMQYFGYLRRNPNDPPEATLDFAGYNFWLTKLNQFNGNFAEAEMVKAFIQSAEYRQRFGP